MADAAALYGAGRLDEAAELLRRLEARDPGDIPARYALAVIDARRGRWSDARRRLEVVTERRPDHFGAWHNLGVARQSQNDWTGSAEAYAAALRVDPDAAESAFSLAVARAVIGDVEGAAILYRRLAARRDLEVRALTRLAILRPSAIADMELARLRELALTASNREPPAGDAEIGVTFALAGVLEARGEIDEAWGAYTAGNAMKHQALTMGPARNRPATVAAEHAESVRRIRRLFTADFLASQSGHGEARPRPIFIIGMPRSGSSLIEQILASHPEVQGMGESGALWGVLDGRFPYPPQAPRNDGHFRWLASQYVLAQGARGLRPAAHLVDKTLDNHLHVGTIHLMFPRAIILHASRGALDTGLACYRQLFANGNETLYDLGDIGREMRRYDEMLAHWRTVLPERVVEVSYEALVEDPADRIRWLVTEVCGLRWSDACLNFHETIRPVGTASADQVRRPIYRHALYRGQRFHDRLGPLEAALRNEKDPA